MAKSIICEGKTTTEAINKGLKELNCKKEDVDIKILEEEKKAFFSILDQRVVKVELTLKDEKTRKENDEKESHKEVKENVEKKKPTEEDIVAFKASIKEFLDKFVELYKNINYSIKDEEDTICITIDGEDSGKLIGYRGETINALQNLLSTIGNKNTKIRVRCYIDIEGYKERREETLKALASKLERTVRRTGKKVTLEPMTAYERKIIHTALQNSKYVTTYSIGEEPRRKVVVDKK